MEALASVIMVIVDIALLYYVWRIGIKILKAS